MTESEEPQPNLRLAIRIIQGQLEMQRENDEVTRAALGQGIAADLQRLGPAPLAPHEHTRLSAVHRKRAEALFAQDLEAALSQYIEACAHGLWSGHSAIAQECLRAYLRARSLQEMS